MGGGGVYVGGFVPTGTEGDVKLQPNEASINRVEKTNFRLIGKICIPFQINMSE